MREFVSQFSWLVVLIGLGLSLVVGDIQLGSYIDIVCSLLVASGLFVSCIGLGRLLFSTATVEESVILGVASWAIILLLFSWFSIQGTVWLHALSIGYVLRSMYRSDISFPSWDASSSLFVVLFLYVLLLFVLCFVPVIDSDSLYYQLALPKHMWLENRLMGGEWRPNGSRPLTVHLLLAHVYGLGGILAMRVFFWQIVTVFLGSILYRSEKYRKGSAWWILALLVGSYSCWEEFSVVNTDVFVMFAIWLCFIRLFDILHTDTDDRPKFVVGVLLGFAIATKYTGGVVAMMVGLCGLWYRHDKEKRLYHNAMCEFVVVLCMVFPWWIRNILEGLHPLFPFAGWKIPMQFMYVEKYGMGRDAWNMFLAPWNLLRYAKPDSLVFMGQLSPLFALSGVCVFYAMWANASKKLYCTMAIVLVSWVAWIIGPQWIRHLFPCMAIVLWMCGDSLQWIYTQVSQQRVFSALVILVTLLGSGKNLLPFLEKQQDIVLGNTEIATQDALQWVNTHTPTDSTIALVGIWEGLLLDRPYVLGSLEDHTPMRHWLLQYQETAIQALRDQGVDYILVKKPIFYQKSYPFIEKDLWQRQWVEPLDNLETLLLRDARFIQKTKGVGIYQLP